MNSRLRQRDVRLRGPLVHAEAMCLGDRHPRAPGGAHARG
jgi:hypothetical protein